MKNIIFFQLFQINERQITRGGQGRQGGVIKGTAVHKENVLFLLYSLLYAVLKSLKTDTISLIA